MASLLRWYEHGVDKILGINDNNDEMETRGGRSSRKQKKTRKSRR